MPRHSLVASTIFLAVCSAGHPTLAGDALRTDAAAALAKATAFLRGISTGGGYVGIYSADLKQRFGEAKYHRAKANHIWVQPPGTPTVGQVYLAAYRATGDKTYLSAARDVGRALAWGQSTHGGWTYLCDMSALMADPRAAKPPLPRRTDTFDDNTTQAAAVYLMDLDRVWDEPWLDAAVRRALGFFRRSQFPNGAWPQRYPLPKKGYGRDYTFNDNAINDCIRVMMRAHDQYGRPGRQEYLESVRRAGDFILLAQLPAPQAGWAQQYSRDLKPSWARSFEPPGVCSAVTSRNIRTLIDLAVYTGEAKYLKTIPPAIDWLQRSRLDGKDTWARLYELKTNRPIYGDRDRKVHYTLEEISAERRKGYSWQSSYGIPQTIRAYQRIRAADLAALHADRLRRAREPAKRSSRTSRLAAARKLAPKVKSVIARLDKQGRWLDDGWITTATFVKNARVLVTYLDLTREDDKARP